MSDCKGLRRAGATHERRVGRRRHTGHMASPAGFVWSQRKNGDVVISHHGKPATVLRGERAQEFIDDIGHGEASRGEAQALMARLTGNYKRGNERTARNHPRNQQR